MRLTLHTSRLLRGATRRLSHDPGLAKVPVTILAGYLGAGKTTTLNAVLRRASAQNTRVAVVINEFGDAGIDSSLVALDSLQSSNDDIVELPGGCACCVVRSDLIQALAALIQSKWDAPTSTLALDRVIIELSGLASPGPVAQTFFAEEFLNEYLHLDGIVSVVDAVNGLSVLRDGSPEAVDQAAFADRLVVNKTDLVADEGMLQELEAALREINSAAPLFRTEKGSLAEAAWQDIGGFDLDAIDRTMSPYIAHGHGHSHSHDHHQCHDHDHDHDHGHQHDSDIQALVLESKDDLDSTALSAWMATLQGDFGPQIYRLKGILSLRDEPRRLVCQGVHMMFQSDFSRPWTGDEARSSKLVLIGRSLSTHEEALRQGFLACSSTIP